MALKLGVKMKINDLIKELSGLGIRFELETVDGSIAYLPLSGFYKSDGLTYIREVDGNIVLEMRYGEEKIVEDISDIVSASYDWYEYSKDRFDGWAQPDALWGSLYEKYGHGKFVERTVKEWVAK